MGKKESSDLPVIKDYSGKKPVSDLTKFQEGQFSLTPEEEVKIAKEARADDKDPDTEVELARQTMNNATETLRREKAEEARGQLITEIEGEFRQKGKM